MTTGQEDEESTQPEQARGRQRPASLAQALAWFAGPYGVAIIGYLLLNAAAARLLGREGLAAFVVAMTAATLVGQLGLFGVHRSGLREAARLAPDDLEGLGRLRGGVVAVSITTLPLAAVVTGVAAFFLSQDRGDATALGTAVATAALTYLSGQQKLLANYLRGLGHPRISGLLEGRSGGAAVALGQALLVVLVWQLRPEWGLVGALAAAALGFLPPVVLAWLLLARRWRGAAAPRGALRSLRIVLARDWKFAVSQLGGFTNSTVDLWICSLLLPASTASLFAAGQRLAQLLLIPMTAMQVVFSPAISRLSADPDRGKLQRLVRTGSTLATALVGIACIPMLVVPTLPLDLVFGEAFRDAAPVLVLLAGAYFMNAVSGMSGITLSMTHHEGYVARVQWIGVVCRVALGAFAAWQFGLVGVAVTSSVVTVLVYALMWFHARSHVGVVTHATLRPHVRLLGKVAG